MNGVEGTCNNETYYEYGVSYDSIVSALDAAQPMFVTYGIGGLYTALSVSAWYSNGIYSVVIYYLDGLTSSGGGYIANFAVLSLYSDTADGNMRDIDCWGEGGSIDD